MLIVNFSYIILNNQTDHKLQTQRQKHKTKTTKRTQTLVYIPLEKHGFLKGTPEAGLLVTQTLAGVAVLSGAVDSATPVQVLLVARVGSLAGAPVVGVEDDFQGA